MYDPKFSQKQMYDQYGRSRESSKKVDPKPSRSSGFGGMGPDPAEQFGGSPTKGIGAKPPSFGGGQDNNPNRDESENKSTVAKVYEKAVDFFKSFGAKEPEALIVDGKRVYQGPAFRGYDPTTRIGQFGGEYGKKNYFLGMESFPTYPRTDVSPTLPPSTINAFGVNRDNPRLNMFGVNRSFTQPPASPDLPTSPDAPEVTISTEEDYTIQLGDTLSGIAKDRNTTVDVLLELNNIKEEDKNKIFAGDNLKVPPKKLTATQAALRRSLGSKVDYGEGVEVAGAYPLVNAIPPLVPSIDLEDAIITRLKTEDGIDYVAEKKFGEKFYTIGHGHYGPDVKEGQTITAKEADALLREDLTKRMPKIRSKIKNFDSLSQELQVEIAQSWFRGGIAGSPKTIKLINEGKFQEASEEFLDNNEYRTTNLRGVKRRMKGLSDTLAKEADK